MLEQARQALREAKTAERGAVRLYGEPQPGELLVEAGNRIATGKEAVPVGWERLSQERRSDVLARRLKVESDAARQIAQRVMWP